MLRIETKADRKKAIELLNIVRKNIELKRENFVCIALAGAVNVICPFDFTRLVKCSKERKSYARVSSSLREQISTSLGNHAHVTSWLVDQGIDYFKVQVHQRAYRLLWIDSMISQLES
jgi:hypothetical protein